MENDSTKLIAFELNRLRKEVTTLKYTLIVCSVLICLALLGPGFIGLGATLAAILFLLALLLYLFGLVFGTLGQGLGKLIVSYKTKQASRSWYHDDPSPK